MYVTHCRRIDNKNRLLVVPCGNETIRLCFTAAHCRFRANPTHARLNLTSWSGIAPARSVPVQAEAAKLFAAKTDGDRDIFFRCEHCKMSLVVNRAATGMSVSCQRCGKLTAVSKTSAPVADNVVRLRGIQRCLTENESQRTEATGYIKQLNIQWHRWQVRLQTLNEHKQQLEKELASLKP